MPNPALALLNHHLEPMIRLNGKMYPQSKVDRVYQKLSRPKPPNINPDQPDRFYEGDRAQGSISHGGNVNFMTRWDEFRNPEYSDYENDILAWSYKNPKELGIEQTSPLPVRDLIRIKQAWVARTRMPDGSIRPSGSGLYYNTPISDHRADAYLKSDFIDIPPTSMWEEDTTRVQVADLRRWQDNPTLAELYSYKDAARMDEDTANALLRNREAKLPQLVPQMRVAARQGIYQTSFAPQTPLPIAPSTNWAGGGANGSYGYRDW